MPGLHGKNFDTSNWNAENWRRARLWNIVFLIGWCAFFAYAIIELLYSSYWFMLAASASIAIAGAVPQIVWLVRVTSWLNREQTRQHKS